MRLTYEILKFLNKNMFEWGHIYFNKGNDMSAHIYVDSSSTRTELHPCSIEALGMTDEVSLKAFAVGSYELNETTGDRKGQITVFNESTKVIGQLELDSGVLDMKVIKCGRNNSICTLVSAESNGQLSIYSIQETSKKPSLTSTSSYLAISPITEALPLDGPFGLALSVDVCENTLVASYQDGAIATFALTESDLTPTGSLVHTHTMSSIDQPVWTVAFNKHACPDGNYFLSGGDDCCMKLWDLRIARSPVHVERRYDAGVTSAQWHPSEGNIFATGSYDENVRIWDDRMLAKPIHKIHTGGGVWRTKWTVAGGCSFLTLACMQAGSKVYALASDYSVHGVCEHSGAESNELSYGIDILSADTNTLIIGSCSFYNNSVHVWESSFSN